MICPICRRDIIVEHGRWTRHTLPGSFSLNTRKHRQCEAAEKPLKAYPPTTPPQGEAKSERGDKT